MEIETTTNARKTFNIRDNIVSQNNQFITSQEIQKLENFFVQKYPTLNFEKVFGQIAQNFRVNYPSPKEITKIASFIQVQQPQVPLNQIIEALYKNVQQKKSLIQECEVIYQWIYVNFPDMKPQKIIQEIYDYTHIGQTKFGQIQQIQLKARKCMKQNQYMYSRIQSNGDRFQKSNLNALNEINPVKIQQENNKNNQVLSPQQEQIRFDEISNIRCDSTRQFKGYLLESLTSQKEIQNFKNQKKIVHVFTKRGYGIKNYQDYLNKRKLDEKQWKFFKEELIGKNKYQEYLQAALRFTLYSMEQFLKASFNKRGMKLYSIKEGPFQRLLPSLVNLQAPFKDLQEFIIVNCYFQKQLKFDKRIQIDIKSIAKMLKVISFHLLHIC